MTLMKQIVVATDFSEAAGHALDYALELAQQQKAQLTVLHVYEVPAIAYAEQTYLTLDVFKALEDAARQQLEALMKKVHERMPSAQSVLKLGVAAETIVLQAERLGADLIVLGTHGRRGLSHLVLGSVAERTLRHAKMPVLVLHAPATKPA
jgi:universal stress protein A